jgi:hypothetical protein
MDDRKLVAFLNGQLSGHEFQVHLNDEVIIWADRLRERGRSASIHLSGHRHLGELTPRRAIRLLDALISTELTPTAFLYILDAILTTDRIRWPVSAVRDNLEELSNPEVADSVDMAAAVVARKSLAANFLTSRNE